MAINIPQSRNIVIACLLLGWTVHAESLLWDASPSADVTSYKVYVTSGGRLVRTWPVKGLGIDLDLALQGLPKAQYVIYATAINSRNIESVPSNQVAYRKKH